MKGKPKFGNASPNIGNAPQDYIGHNQPSPTHVLERSINYESKNRFGLLKRDENDSATQCADDKEFCLCGIEMRNDEGEMTCRECDMTDEGDDPNQKMSNKNASADNVIPASAEEGENLSKPVGGSHMPDPSSKRSQTINFSKCAQRVYPSVANARAGDGSPLSAAEHTHRIKSQEEYKKLLRNPRKAEEEEKISAASHNCAFENLEQFPPISRNSPWTRAKKKRAETVRKTTDADKYMSAIR